MGHNDEALAVRRIVYELEPNSPHYSGTLAVELAFTRQYDDAINQFQRTIELDSDQVITWFVLGETYLYVNKFEDATRAFVRFAELTGENKEVMQQYVSLIEEHKRSGEPVSPPPELVKELAEIAGLGDGTPFLYAFLGQKERTLEVLEQFYKKGIYFPEYHHPVFDSLRSEPRFIALERKYKQSYGLEEE